MIRLGMDEIVAVADPKQRLYVLDNPSVHASGTFAHPFDEYWSEGEKLFGFINGKLVELLDGVPNRNPRAFYKYRQVGWMERWSRRRNGLRYAATIGIL